MNEELKKKLAFLFPEDMEKKPKPKTKMQMMVEVGSKIEASKALRAAADKVRAQADKENNHIASLAIMHVSVAMGEAAMEVIHEAEEALKKM